MEFNFDRSSQAFSEILYNMRVSGVSESSRNGRVITIPEPVLVTIRNPLDRVIMCQVRNANPFFHIMEVVWMLAGDNRVEWLKQFNSNIEKYADDGVIHGAYGRRWYYHPTCFYQLPKVIEKLRSDKETRQAVLAMWEPDSDLTANVKDRPCNTHIYFRIMSGKLNMMVCNRSNDLVWGMFGANIVHMTYLQEFVAGALGLEVGRYSVATNNLHFYPDVYPNADTIWEESIHEAIGFPCEVPILNGDEDYRSFHLACKEFIEGTELFAHHWLSHVALPMKWAYLDRKLQYEWACKIKDPAWKVAAISWLKRNRPNA